MSTQMFDEIPEEELDRIERLADAARAGPWISYVAGRDTDIESNFIELGWCNELGSFACIELIGGSIADQDFIASARQDLPRLLAEIRALRARLDSLLAHKSNAQLHTIGCAADGPSSLRRASI